MFLLLILCRSLISLHFRSPLGCMLHKFIWTIFWGHSISVLHTLHPIFTVFQLMLGSATVLLYALWGWALWTPFLRPSCWLTSDWVWQWEAPSDINEGEKREIWVLISFLSFSLDSSYTPLMTAPPKWGSLFSLLQLSLAFSVPFLPFLLKPKVEMTSSYCSFMDASLYYCGSKQLQIFSSLKQQMFVFCSYMRGMGQLWLTFQVSSPSWCQAEIIWSFHDRGQKLKEAQPEFHNCMQSFCLDRAKVKSIHP